MSLVLKVPNLDWEVTPQITQVVGIVVVGINVGIVVIGITVTCNIGIVIFLSRDCSSRHCYPTRILIGKLIIVVTFSLRKADTISSRELPRYITKRIKP
jgi:hypothetical protein